ncbi:tocopherol cyclase [Hordeum vulgare]|nr:tocopherol cyclase [Hordeum vulgare]
MATPPAPTGADGPPPLLAPPPTRASHRRQPFRPRRRPLPPPPLLPLRPRSASLPTLHLRHAPPPAAFLAGPPAAPPPRRVWDKLASARVVYLGEAELVPRAHSMLNLATRPLWCHPRARCSVSPRAATEPPPAAVPAYAPTPRDRPLRTPHSGYHYDGTARAFFEGWYFKVSIPECRQSFCFMYSVENPFFRDGMTALDQAIHSPRFTGVGAHILGADDKYICQYSEKSNNFWGRCL